MVEGTKLLMLGRYTLEDERLEPTNQPFLERKMI